MTLWRSWELPRNEGSRIHKLGDVHICVAVQQAGEGDILATMPIYPDPSPSDKKPARTKASLSLPSLSDAAWTRFFMGKENTYDIVPSYPPLPVCVHLKDPFSLPPGSTLEGWIFSKIEASIHVKNVTVASYPLSQPHKTLYGTPDAGVVCRYDEAEFLASSEPIVSSFNKDPRYVAHPVRLKNLSSEPVMVSDLCIYGEQLSIYEVDSKMQSERIIFIFTSAGVRMSLDWQSQVPPGAITIAKPAVSGEERLIERSFALFKTITRI